MLFSEKFRTSSRLVKKFQTGTGCGIGGSKIRLQPELQGPCSVAKSFQHPSKGDINLGKLIQLLKFYLRLKELIVHFEGCHVDGVRYGSWGGIVKEYFGVGDIFACRKYCLKHSECKMYSKLKFYS